MPEQTDQTELPEEITASDQDGTAEPKSSLAAKVRLAGFALAVVVLECAAAYLYIPSKPDASALEAPLQAEADLEAEFEDAAETTEDQLEVELGDFTVTSFQPISNTTLRIDFLLFGTIDKEDEEDFKKAMEQSKHRLRDQVIEMVLDSELTDLTDAGLGLIKRKILEKVNRTLGRPFLKMIVFSDFSFIEQ